jgi:hypothetical protein
MSDGADNTRRLLVLVNMARCAAWAEGHLAPQRWANGCACGAEDRFDCACGKWGPSELLSLDDNPYL